MAQPIMAALYHTCRCAPDPSKNTAMLIKRQSLSPSIKGSLQSMHILLQGTATELLVQALLEATQPTIERLAAAEAEVQ